MQPQSSLQPRGRMCCLPLQPKKQLCRTAALRVLRLLQTGLQSWLPAQQSSLRDQAMPTAIPQQAALLQGCPRHQCTRVLPSLAYLFRHPLNNRQLGTSSLLAAWSQSRGSAAEHPNLTSLQGSRMQQSINPFRRHHLCIA